MSDGNFNRALLPHTPYASGLKAGRAQERQHALEAFDKWLIEKHPELTDAEHCRWKEEFHRCLSAYG